MRASLLVFSFLMLSSCSSGPATQTQPPAPPQTSSARPSDFERQTVLSITKRQSDPIRADLDGIIARVCKENGRDPDQISFALIMAYLGESDCLILTRACNGVPNPAARENIYEKCFVELIESAKNKKTVPSKIPLAEQKALIADVCKTCLKSL